MSDWQQDEEAHLIQQARQGDAGAYGQIYDRYAPRVFRFLFAHLDNRLDAEDLTEEVFLRVWQNLPTYRQRGIPFSGFVFRVARNALYDHYRQLRRRGTVAEIHEEWPAAEQSDPAQSVAQQLERRDLLRKLAGLSEDYRTVLSLRFLAGLSAEETAQAMSRSNGAIRVLQHRALAALRSLLEEEAGR